MEQEIEALEVQRELDENNAEEIRINVEIDGEVIVIPVFKNMIIYDVVTEKVGRPVRDITEIRFGDDLVSREDTFNDWGIEDGGRLQVAFFRVPHPGELLIGAEFMTPEMPDEDPGEEDNRRLIKTWDSIVGQVWTFGYVHDENNEKYWHPQSDGLGGGGHKVIFGTVNLNLPEAEQRDEQRERVQRDNNNVHEALLENGWIPRPMPRQPWVYPSTHYIHNSFVGHDGQEKPDAYWECRGEEKSY